MQDSLFIKLARKLNIYIIQSVSKVTNHWINRGNLVWCFPWIKTVLSQAFCNLWQHKTANNHKLFAYCYYTLIIHNTSCISSVSLLLTPNVKIVVKTFTEEVRNNGKWVTFETLCIIPTPKAFRSSLKNVHTLYSVEEFFG